ncbi:STAS domain-containing protein [Streptomyces sp. NPDC004111]|uniref:STAS domain-containing protein n=1 Tax=Streptomyces sp. NPDC004111 TaxID=3364690 RepID=UPI0036C3CF22
MDRLTIRQTRYENSVFPTLVLTGELEVSNIDRLSDAVIVLEGREHHLRLDLAEVTWCDSGSLFTLLGIRHAAGHLGGSLALPAASPAVHTALQVAGLHELRPVTPPR